ncbi:PTS transporter subunit EIIC [Spiroplasma taiwanense]|uniref:PTS transporter subunit EIIC n=1 Tax=Spiroplasma taiwanense TaxID=2145 RepID=UPI0004095C97|nr:PTS transporter subunit EIIC [Spiroplasma taiwanense]
MSLTWFLGIYTSVWSGITDTLAALGLEENIVLVNQGEHASNLCTDPFKMGAFSMGGTGAQIAVPLAIILFCKSKQLKSIGLVAIIPIMFQVNEPVLFGIPTILNPLMAISFLLTPIFNSLLGVFLLKF